MTHQTASKNLHKQPRGYLKTVARLAGKDTDRSQVNFWTSGNYDGKTTLRKTMPKNVAIAGSHLFRLWQRGKNDEGYLVIKNLSTISCHLRTTPQRLKYYLIYLGGYQYPLTTRNGRSLVQVNDKLCQVYFITNGNRSDTPEHKRVGTRYLYFHKGTPIKAVKIKLIETFISDLMGKNLGNVLVSDDFVPFCQKLSLMAYRLFCFTASNTPEGTYRFRTLIRPRFLNLTDQIESQHKSRVLGSIISAFEELECKGHFERWDYDEGRDLFTWKYSDLVVKHKDLLKAKS